MHCVVFTVDMGQMHHGSYEEEEDDADDEAEPWNYPLNAATTEIDEKRRLHEEAEKEYAIGAFLHSRHYVTGQTMKQMHCDPVLVLFYLNERPVYIKKEVYDPRAIRYYTARVLFAGDVFRTALGLPELMPLILEYYCLMMTCRVKPIDLIERHLRNSVNKDYERLRKL